MLEIKRTAIYYRSRSAIHLAILTAICMKSAIANKKEFFTSAPSNLAICVGMPLRMKCGGAEKNLTIQWNYYSPKNKTRLAIYNGEVVGNRSFAGDFSVEKTLSRRRDLVTMTARLEHAGTYECTVLVFGLGSKATVDTLSSKAELVVLASHPKCETNLSLPENAALEYDFVQMQCQLNYSGNWIPSMHWFMEDDDRILHSESIQSHYSGISGLISVFIIQVSPIDNGTIYCCKTHFTQSNNRIKTNATNVPDYVYQWNTTVIVHYGPRNISITPMLESYQLGTEIRCTADGNPEPKYIWRNLNSSIVGTGSVLKINEPISEDDILYVYECIAENVVVSEKKTISIKIYIKIQGQLAVGYFTIALGILCLLLTIMLVYVNRKHIKDTCLNLQLIFQRQDQNKEPDIVSNVEESGTPSSVLSSRESAEQATGHYQVIADYLVSPYEQLLTTDNTETALTYDVIDISHVTDNVLGSIYIQVIDT